MHSDHMLTFVCKVQMCDLDFQQEKLFYAYFSDWKENKTHLSLGK